MTIRIKLTHLIIGIVAGAMLAGGGYAFAAAQNHVIHACVNTKSRALTVPASGRCAKGSAALAWDQQGPKGAAGARGAAGADGTPATVKVGTVTTAAAGSQASVTNSGTGSNAVLNFGIPQGAAGQDGVNTGPTAYGEIWEGNTTAELAPGNSKGIVNVGGGGGSGAGFAVPGCSAAGLKDPVVTATANQDPNDALAGANDSTSSLPIATDVTWDTQPDTNVLVVHVQTTNTSDALINSDFAVTVIC